MNTEAAPSSVEIHALLIGINRYYNLSARSQLNGCVRDVNRVEAFLKQRLGLKTEQLIKLTASHDQSESEDILPTYKNIKSALVKVLERAQPGQHVYIHYSGHGGRVATTFPEIKTALGFDEGLVPCDIQAPGADLLRDVELASWLQKMIDKHLIVTVILDCCHSGGATRGTSTAMARQVELVDFVPPFPDGNEREHLIANWKRRSKEERGNARNLSESVNWLADPTGYVLLAASRETESAYEDVFDDGDKWGALTYWMLQSLKLWSPQMTFKMLHDRILGRIHSRYENQTPMLVGSGDRVVFGHTRLKAQSAVTVMSVSPDQTQMVIEVGQAGGIRTGSRFALYAAGPFNSGDSSQRVAMATVTDVQADRSTAVLSDVVKQDSIVPGAQAVLIDPGDTQLRRSVRLIILEKHPDDPTQTHPVNVVAQQAALERVRATLQTDAVKAWVRIEDDASQPAEFQVVVGANATFEVWDAAGVFIQLRPPLPTSTDSAPARVAERLVHLTKYRNVQDISNYDEQSYLANKLQIELVGWQANYVRGNKSAPQPFTGTPKIQVGQTLFVRITNLLPKQQSVPGQPEPNILNVAVLDLQPDWGISQVYPDAMGRFIEVTPGVPFMLDLKANLPDGMSSGKDVLKAFATLTTKTTNFRWLELPVLDQPLARSAKNRETPRSNLEALFAAVAEQEPQTRTLTSSANTSDNWATAQVEILVERDATASNETVIKEDIK